MLFQREKEQKEKLIESLTKELSDLKITLRIEKKTLEDLEDKENNIDDEKAALQQQLEALDEELDILDGDSDDPEEQERLKHEDEDLLIQKLEQEAAYLDKLLKSADEEVQKQTQEIQQISSSNQMTEHENQTLENKLKNCGNIEEELKELQNDLTESLDKEKELFDENLKLLNLIKQLEEQEQQQNKNKEQKESYVNSLVEQQLLERKTSQITLLLREFFEKVQTKVKIFNDMKWKIEEAQKIVQKDLDIKKATGMDSFKSKLDKFSLDISSVIQKKESIETQKQAIEELIYIKEIKNASSTQIAQCMKSLQNIEVELDQLVQKENDILDISKLQKNYIDFERDTEMEFMRKFKSLKNQLEHDYQLVTLMQDNAFSDLNQQNQNQQKLKKMLYELEPSNLQYELNQQMHVTLIRENADEYKGSSKDIKLFYQLQYLSSFNKKAVSKSDIKQTIQSKLKKISDNLSELDKILSNNQNNLDQIQKEGSYLRESEFSPVKGRVSIVYGAKGDLEKEKEMHLQHKQIEQQAEKLDQLQQEKDKLKKLLKQYQQKFDEMDLENSSMIQLEELVDDLNTDLDCKTDDLKTQVKNQLDQELGQLQTSVSERIQKFQDKRQVLANCKQEEKEKRQDIIKCENTTHKLYSRLDKIERDLKNQSGGGFNLSSEKQSQIQQDFKDIASMKKQLDSLNKEIEDQKNKVHYISQDMNQIGDKILTLDNLKAIYSQLIEMNKLKKIQEQLKNLSELMANKEASVEQFIKEMVGSSLFECEKKYKEAEQLVETISKRIIGLNNGMNDFELDVKKGFHLYGENEDINQEGKRLFDENTQERKELKGIEDQKNMIRKVLHRIKNALNEQEQNKAVGKVITAATLDEYINEIDTCLNKCGLHNKDMNRIDQNLAKRKADWNKLLFTGGAQEALIEDIQKILKDNLQNYSQLEKKLTDVDKAIIGLEEVSKNMLDNPDYEHRKASIQKMLDSLQKTKNQRDDIKKQMSAIQSNINKIQAASEKGLRTFSVENLQELTRTGEESADQMTKEQKKADQILKDLAKNRRKLGDADIYDNFKQRIETLGQIDTKIKTIEDEQQELDKIIYEASKINPYGVKESIAQIQDIKKQIGTVSSDKIQLLSKINQLKDKLKAKDLNRDDPSSFIPLINEIKEIRKQLDSKDNQLLGLSKQIKYLKNKHGGVDIDKKFEQYKLKANDVANKLQGLAEDSEVLKELYEEFDGYTSDNQEEDFIDRLGVEVREINSKHATVVEQNEYLLDKIQKEQKDLSRNQDQINSADIEKRAQAISEIEEESYHLDRLVEDIERKINRNKKVLMGMEVKDKLDRREQEIIELSKRLEQFESTLNEVDIDIQQEIYQLKSGQGQPSQETMNILEQIATEMNQIKKDYQQPGLQLKQISGQIDQLKQSMKNIHQFELLKSNLKIKKQILSTLALIKQIRIHFNQVKLKYDTNKPQKQIAYKPIKGDYVDQLIADWINNNSCPVPIQRLGNGFYVFGTKKIFAKIINGKLLIRVGGGYMGIDEFMFYYGAQELNKMLAYEDFDGDEEIDFDKALDVDSQKSDVIKQFGDGKAIIGNQAFKKRLSPRPTGSPRAGSPNAQALMGGKRSQQTAGSPRASNLPGQGSPRSRIGSNASRKSPHPASLLKQGSLKTEGSEESMRKIEQLREKKKNQ